ncbi:unnamed protein product [Mytilus coruscus]|uniref:Retrotransposon gag domain-containing protein n=1 Tax=Mytilus coruscus TaxID=42192 RepID=A0A6J8EVU9_MYTCO|nr:unnamed protein product [Mytilus coruscus]
MKIYQLSILIHVALDRSLNFNGGELWKGITDYNCFQWEVTADQKDGLPVDLLLFCLLLLTADQKDGLPEAEAGLQPKWAGGGQNIGPPPEDKGRHDEMLNRVNTVVDGGHIAPQGTPSRVHGQSAFKQEAWHQGQSPGHWGGPSQMDSAYLDYSPYPGDARARPKTPGNWDGGYSEQLQKKEWRHHIIGDPKQGNPPHQGSSIGNKLYGPDEDSALDKNVQTKGGTPSHPRGHASNYASQGSAPCAQPAHTGWGKYETPCSRYAKWQDNQGEDTRQVPAHTYGERQDNRGEDTRQTPARAYWGQGNPIASIIRVYTGAPAWGHRRGSYGQQAYPVPYNEDRPRENTRGPDSRGGAQGTLGGVSKVTNAPKNIKYDGKGNWQAFFTKFARYAEVCEWGPQECKDQLCWCLEGKASEYYALITERDQEVSYRELVEKLHKRFGFKALPETARVQFNNARQTPEESVEDWADRVLSLATRAFRNLPDDYMYEQAITRLCQGIENKQLGCKSLTFSPIVLRRP